MLGRHLELPADVVLDQLSKEGRIGIVGHIIKAHAAAHEDLFDTGKRAQRTQDVQILRMVHLEIGAGFVAYATLVFTHAALLLLVAGVTVVSVLGGIGYYSYAAIAETVSATLSWLLYRRVDREIISKL